MENIRKHLEMLGYAVRDRVTGLEGIVTSIGFDLYGCIQAVVNLGLDKEAQPDFVTGPKDAGAPRRNPGRPASDRTNNHRPN